MIPARAGAPIVIGSGALLMWLAMTVNDMRADMAHMRGQLVVCAQRATRYQPFDSAEQELRDIEQPEGSGDPAMEGWPLTPPWVAPVPPGALDGRGGAG